MQRVTITLDDDLMADLDRIIASRGYQNRSEAIRDLARSGLEQAAVEVAGTRNCVAALVYVYDHHARDLPKRLTQEFMTITICRRRRCMCISTTKAALKSPC
jgi:CopG family nickel-responsive transcriptional regulator